MTFSTLFILGAGYTGQRLARLARTAEIPVIASTSNPDTRHFLESIGADVLDLDVQSDDLDLSFLPAKTALVYSVPTLHRDYAPADALKTARHVQPVARVLDAFRPTDPAHFLYLSSTSVYGDHDGQWITEDAARRPSAPFGKMRRDIEDFLLQQPADFPLSIARIVGIYGPDRTLLSRLQSPDYQLVDGGKKITNRIHVHDLARAILHLLHHHTAPTADAFNFSDGHPISVSDLVDLISALTGLQRPPEISLEDYAQKTQNPNLVARWKNTARISNQKLTDLGFDFRYPDALSGYRALLAD